MTYDYDALSVSDLYKDVMGFRPDAVWKAKWMAADEDGKQRIWDRLIEQLKEDGDD